MNYSVRVREICTAKVASSSLLSLANWFLVVIRDILLPWLLWYD